jgi:hypothetical protein
LDCHTESQSSYIFITRNWAAIKINLASYSRGSGSESVSRGLYVFRNGAASLTKKGSVFLCRRYVFFTVISARVHVYMRCHAVQVTMERGHPLSLHCAKGHLCKVYRGFMLMQACAAGYALTYLTTLKLLLAS